MARPIAEKKSQATKKQPLVQQWMRITQQQQDQLNALAEGIGVSPATYLRMAFKNVLDERWIAVKKQ